MPVADEPVEEVPGAPSAVEEHPPGQRFTVVLNATSGAKDDEVAGRVRAALAAAGISATIRVGHGSEVARLARHAVDDPACDVVIAAGGDGTVSAVAGAVAGTEKLLAVLPTGTLNHFAKDLGMPAELDDAAAAIASARVHRIDVAEVNGIPFVNNSSVGIYPRIVLERERLRRRFGHGKWLATAWGLVAVVLRLRPLSLRFRWPGGTAVRRTTFAFIGNNEYDTALLETQRRKALDGGVLGVFVGTERTRRALLRLAVRAALRRIDARDVEALEVREITLESHRGTLWVAVDGEVRRLRPPLHYRIRPCSLLMLAPSRRP